MKTDRNNIVCIVLMSILIVFAVSLCVFYNLNALVTNNIAFASGNIVVPFENSQVLSSINDPICCDTSKTSELNTILSGLTYDTQFTSTFSITTLISCNNDISFVAFNNSGDYGVGVISDTFYFIYATASGSIADIGFSYSSGWQNLDSSNKFYWYSDGSTFNHTITIKSNGIHDYGYNGVIFGYAFTGTYADGYDAGYDAGLIVGSESVYSLELARINSSDFTTQSCSSALVPSTSKYFIGNNSGIQLYKGSTGYPYGLATLWDYNYIPSQYDNSIFYYFYIPFSHGVVKGSKITFTGVSTNLYQESNTDYSAFYFRLVNRQDNSRFGNLSYAFVNVPYSTDNVINYLDNLSFIDYVNPDRTITMPYGYLYGSSDIPSYVINDSVKPSCDFYCNTGVSYGMVLRISEYDFLSISGDIVVSTSNISSMGNSQEDLINEFNRGKNVGYSEGYQYAVNNTNDYTFLGLFSSVIEAPVSVISNALDFELLGYNLKNFLFALLTIALVLFIIKLFV